MELIRIFISSVQKEFAEERGGLRDYLRGDPLMHRFLTSFCSRTAPPKIGKRMTSYLTKYIERIGTYQEDYYLPFYYNFGFLHP